MPRGGGRGKRCRRWVWRWCAAPLAVPPPPPRTTPGGCACLDRRCLRRCRNSLQCDVVDAEVVAGRTAIFSHAHEAESMPSLLQIQPAQRTIDGNVDFRQVVVEDFRPCFWDLGRCGLAAVEIGWLSVQESVVVAVVGRLGDARDNLVASFLGNV